MKEPALHIQLHYMPGTTDTGKMSIDFESINDHKQEVFLQCPVDWLTDPGPPASHLNVTETGGGTFTGDGGYQHENILCEDYSTRPCEDEVKMKESVGNCVSGLLSDSVNTKQPKHSSDEHILLQHDVSVCYIRKSDDAEQRADGICEHHYDFFHEGAKSQRSSENASSSILGDPDIYNEKTIIHPLNFYTSNIDTTNNDSRQLETQSLIQKTHILQPESFHGVQNPNFSRLSIVEFEIDNKIPSFNNKDNMNDSLLDNVECINQQPLNCLISPNKKTFPSNSGNIQMGDTNMDTFNCLHKQHSSLAVEQEPRDKPVLQYTKENNDVASEKHIVSEKNIVSGKKDSSLREPFLTKYFSCRWKLAYLCFLARFIQTALRQCMGIAIIGMTMQSTTDNTGNVTNATTSNSSQSELPNMIQEFQWSSAFEGVILASFNMGSIITPVIVGYITGRHGGRKLMSACLLVGGMFTVLLPLAAKANPVFIIVFRIITGMALSGTDSLIQGMWAKWAPLYEKASLTACAYSGLSVAGVLTFLLCGYIISIGGEGKGWPYIFYIFGSMCVLLAPLWYISVYDSPQDHPKITKKELAIITFSQRPEHDYNKELHTPWRKIFLSSAVWVIVVGHISHKWILTFMLSYLPRYFSDLFDFDMKMDGVFSSLPFVGRVIAGVIAGHVSDWMRRKGVSTARTRKFFQAIGCWGCAVFTLVIAFVPDLSTVWSVLLLVLALSCQDLTSVAFRINFLDIAPRFAGILNGVASTIATVTSLPAPVITSLLISGGSRQGWQVLFGLVAVLNIIGGVLFVIFAKGEIQDWAWGTYDNTNNEVMVFTLEASRDIKSTELNSTSKESLPVHPQQPCTQQSARAVRKATFGLGSMVKKVQNLTFSSLALADL